MADAVAEQVVGQPAPSLRRFVRKYVGYRQEGFAPGTHAGLPSRHLTFIVSFDRRVELTVMPDRRQHPGSFVTLVGGLHTSPATISHDGNQHGVQLEVTPLGARALFGRPAAELAHQVVGLDDLIGPLAGELVDRLHTSPRWSARFATLDEVLQRAMQEWEEPRWEVAMAWRRILDSDGSTDIGRLATESGWSRRHLSQQFRSEFGVSPKVMSRVVRFERAKVLLTATGTAHAHLGTVAAMSGYADQSHMTREWNDIAGSSPAAWLAHEAIPFVQDNTSTERAS